MNATCKIYLNTYMGPATITSRMEFNSLGSFTVSGPGKKIAREWIKNATGAFGHSIGKYAAPCDLHCAAMDLQQEPEEEIQFVRFEGEIKEYESGVPEGSVP